MCPVRGRARTETSRDEDLERRRLSETTGYDGMSKLCVIPADRIGTDTLIVWTEQNGTDMALSFQEAEGCGAIW